MHTGQIIFCKNGFTYFIHFFKCHFFVGSIFNGFYLLITDQIISYLT